MATSSRSRDDSPRRGDIWIVDFNPTVGSEIQKVRPAVVVSSDALGILPIKLVAPLTEWKAHFAGKPWHVRVVPAQSNGLSKESAVDALQLRGVDVQRFRKRLGLLSAELMEDIAAAIALVVEYA
jgi:mRNA interferase MazF